MQEVKDDKNNNSQNVDSCVESSTVLTSCNFKTSTLHSPQNNSKGEKK